MSADPVCGKCGYIVAGLTSFTCPECGSDLREVGIIRPPKRSWTIYALIAGWAILCMILPWMYVWVFAGRFRVGDPANHPAWWAVWVLPFIIGNVFILQRQRVDAPPAKVLVRIPKGVVVAGWTVFWFFVPWIYIWTFYGRFHVGGPSDPLAFILLWVCPWAFGIVWFVLRAPGEATTRGNRTVTIMFSDIADFAATSAASPREKILELVQMHREVVEPIVKRRGGRIVKSMGDGLLISFDSATDALLAGLEIQSKNVREDLKLRIAVATGEATFTDGDVFGHPVNLASRVQQLATNGDVYFTDSTFHAINRNEVSAEPVGEFDVKGIGKINVYRVAKR